MDKDAALAFIRTQLAESAEVKRQISETAGEALFVGAMMMAQAVRTGHKVMLCGNGGSAADAQHIAAELIGRTRPTSDRAALPALALTTDTSALTALGNDYGFDEVFARQVEGLGQPGDVLIVISTSGNSPNILKAVETARRQQIKVIGLMGRGGQLMGMADHAIAVPSSDTPRIQEAHIAVAHIMCDLVERLLSSTNSREQPAQVAGNRPLP